MEGDAVFAVNLVGIAAEVLFHQAVPIYGLMLTDRRASRPTAEKIALKVLNHSYS